MPLHEPAASEEVRDPAAERWNARLGLFLFAIYCSGYATFVWSCVQRARSFEAVPAGLALILGAMVTAFVYAALCRTPKGTA